MANKQKHRDFSCDNCGRKITAYPPDGAYTQFFIKKCCEKSLERGYDCDNCTQRNIRYWCVFHTAIGVAKHVNTDDYFRSKSL